MANKKIKIKIITGLIKSYEQNALTVLLFYLYKLRLDFSTVQDYYLFTYLRT